MWAKALTEGERARTFLSAKKLVENAKKAAEVLSTAGKTPNPKGGRPSKDGAPQKAVAEALGVSRGTVANAEKQVETAERFPFMQTGKWRQSHVLAVHELASPFVSHALTAARSPHDFVSHWLRRFLRGDEIEGGNVDFQMSKILTFELSMHVHKSRRRHPIPCKLALDPFEEFAVREPRFHFGQVLPDLHGARGRVRRKRISESIHADRTRGAGQSTRSGTSAGTARRRPSINLRKSGA